jgi:hypothetical protein
MGRASRRKREQRESETEEKPVEWTDLVVQAGVAMATGKGHDQ